MFLRPVSKTPLNRIGPNTGFDGFCPLRAKHGCLYMRHFLSKPVSGSMIILPIFLKTAILSSYTAVLRHVLYNESKSLELTAVLDVFSNRSWLPSLIVSVALSLVEHCHVTDGRGMAWTGMRWVRQGGARVV